MSSTWICLCCSEVERFSVENAFKISIHSPMKLLNSCLSAVEKHMLFDPLAVLLYHQSFDS